MRTYDVQDIELLVSPTRAFELIADPAHLPRWTEAFTSAGPRSAIMKTPDGEVEVGLEVDAHPASGTVDWCMTFPDGSVARAHSRVVELAKDRCVYTFVLHAPPNALAAVEGALEQQSVVLAHELEHLKALLERP